MNFIIYSLPRSRTAWLSKFLSCGHDLAIYSDNFESLVNNIKANNGTVETGAMEGFEALSKALPNYKKIVIRRSTEEVIKSLNKLNFGYFENEIVEKAALLDKISVQPNVITVKYEDLNSPNCCQWLFEYLRGESINKYLLNQFIQTNIQIDFNKRIQDLIQRSDYNQNLRNEVKELSGKDILTFSWETWDEFWPEADELVEKHFKEVAGEQEPNRPYKIDATSMKTLNDAGILKLLVARLNGKMVGYLTWNVHYDLESQGLLVAFQGGWYVRPGKDLTKLWVGYKLYTKSIEYLKTIGVKNIFPHYRLRGRGAELDIIMRRLGAQEIQRGYSLWIGD